MLDHCVLQRAVAQRNLDHRTTGLIHCLLHGDRHFLRLAFAHADAAVAVTHHGELPEKTMIRPPFTTLVTRLTPISFSVRPSPRSSISCLAIIYSELECEAVFTGGISQGLDTTVGTGNPGDQMRPFQPRQRFGFFGNALADQGCSASVAAIGQFFLDLGFQRGSLWASTRLPVSSMI